jgi:Arc/MetJ family transcription regulator
MAMATQKRSISFDDAVLTEAERRVATQGGNLSAFVNAAVLRELRVARGTELLAADEAEYGPVPADVAADVAAEWPA